MPIVPIIFALAIAVLMIASMWTVFTKAGQPGWAAIVPIYNFIVLCKVAGKPWWYLFLLMIPVVNIVIAIMVYHGVSTNFGKGGGFTCGLLFLGIIFWPILAFGDAKYVGAGAQQPVNMM